MQLDDADSSPPKKLRSSYTPESDSASPGDQDLLARHVGELLVYFDKSVRPEGMLGFTVEKTWVRLSLAFL